MSAQEKLIQLAAAIKNSPLGFKKKSGEDVIEVSIPASTAAAFYEKVRATLEYQDEHLLRRNAIARILRRLLGGNGNAHDMAKILLTELVWGKYLPNKEIPVRFADELADVFLKYEPIFLAAQRVENKEYAFQWILDVLSTEIEYKIMSHQDIELMATFMYEELKKRVEWDEKLNYHQEEKDLRLFIATHKMLLKSNLATLRYRTFLLYYPDWTYANSELINEIAGNIARVINTVDYQVEHPLTHRLALKVRRKAGVFRVLLDVIKNDNNFQETVSNVEALDKAVEKSLKKNTDIFRKKLKRTAVRAVLFLFITKMFLALIMEVPYDYLIHGRLFFVPLLINILFPPLLLAFISMTASIPEKKNKEDYKSALRAIIVGANHDLLNFRIKKQSRGALYKVFAFVYTLLFIFVYGLIAVGLHKINFNIFSILLFLFFLSLVTFFGIRIRNSTRDIVLSPSRSGMLGTIFDIITLPIMRAGQWLSVKVSKINVFIYFFDFIIESPYKVALRFMEEWFAFVREKKEEI